MTTNSSIKVKADFKDPALTPLWEIFNDWRGSPFRSSGFSLVDILRFIIGLLCKIISS
jgi:hypothetical protein